MSEKASSPSLLLPLLRPRPFPVGLALSLLMALSLAQSSLAGSYESLELSSSEMQSGKRMSPYVSYQPWSYMKRSPGAPLIRFGKRSGRLAEWEEASARNTRAALTNPLIRFGKRMPSSVPLIRFGRRPTENAPLIRFGKRAPLPSGAPLIRFGRSWSGGEGEEEEEE